MVTVSLGPVAHHANKPFFTFTEELQGFLVLLAEVLPSFHLFDQSQVQALGYFSDVGQLPVGSEALLGHRLPALGAGEVGGQSFPVLSDARLAKAVPAVDGHGVLEKFQADGAGGFILEAFHRRPGCHGERQSLFHF